VGRGYSRVEFPIGKYLIISLYEVHRDLLIQIINKGDNMEHIVFYNYGCETCFHSDMISF